MVSVMRTLFIDLGSHLGSVACVEGAAARVTPLDARADDASLAEVIRSALAAAGWTFKDLERLACVEGPGGFTSLRVAVSCVNALAYALNIPAAGLHLADLYAARAGDASSFLWLHSTKRTQLFLRRFPGNVEPECLDLSALASHLRPGDRWVGELLPEHAAAVVALGIEPLPVCPTEEVLPVVLDGLAYGKGTIVPWYGRGW